MSQKSTNEELLEEFRTIFARIGLLVVIGIGVTVLWFSLSWVLTRSSVDFKIVEERCFLSINGTDQEIGCPPTK